MAGGWLCPICGHPNPDYLVVCERTPEHDEATAARYLRAVGEAAQELADARADMAAKPARQVAAEAYVPGGPSVDELEAKVRELRARNRHRAAA